jgi:3',5'-cyclic AMP phosphodiesterase CpdA
VTGTLWAVSDLHVSHTKNRVVLDTITPSTERDWLIVAGDVGDLFADVEWALTRLRSRFEQVIWTPGNHELWTRPDDPVQLRGARRYAALVDMCRAHGVVTPEDDYLVWDADDGPVTIVPIFQLYDYTFRTTSSHSQQEAMQEAYAAGIVCTDEWLLHPDPFPSREAWCANRVANTAHRLDRLAPDVRTVLISHWPLLRQPTGMLRHPQFAQWCGTVRTANWHRRYRAIAAVYGHLHIPRTTEHDGVRFEEVSLGYPHEWGMRNNATGPVRRILSGAPGYQRSAAGGQPDRPGRDQQNLPLHTLQ